MPCPECGYRAPTTEPTHALREAHPSFVRATLWQLRGLLLTDMILVGCLGCLAVAYLVTIVRYPAGRIGVVSMLYGLGFFGIALGLLVGLVFAGMIVRRHPNARADLDQPTRKGLAKAFWWCVGPLGVAIPIAIVTLGAAGCVVVIAIPISMASGGILAFSLFEHNTSIIRRCHADPTWTATENVLSYGSILAFVLFAISIAVLVEATILLMLAGCTMIIVTHALRTRTAIRAVQGVLVEIHGPTSEDQPPASLRS